MSRVSLASLLLVALTMALSSQAALARGVNDYALDRTFNLPAPNGDSFGAVLLDPLPDGRLLLVNGSEVLVENAVYGGSFSSLGSVGAGFTPGFTPTFLAVSPDGSKAAVGDNGFPTMNLVVFDTANPAAATNFVVSNNAGAWIDNTRIAVTSFSGVDVLNTSSGTVTNVINNIGGASAGITFDSAGNLYTGNGYDDTAPYDAGLIKAFSAGQWQGVLGGNPALDFQSTGTPVADLLSAGSLGFDQWGNFYVGGAEFFGSNPNKDAGYAALGADMAVQDALNSPTSPPAVDASAPADVLRKFASPASTLHAFQAPIWNYNPVTDELYLTYFQTGEVQVWTPEPGSLAAMVLGGAAVLMRRKRRAG